MRAPWTRNHDSSSAVLPGIAPSARGALAVALWAILGWSPGASGALAIPEVITVGRLAAYNDGPGKLRAEATGRLPAAPVLVTTAQSLVFKVDWHFVDQSMVRTLDATFSATVVVTPETGPPVSNQQSTVLTTGTSPRTFARDAAALEIPLDLPAGVGLLRCSVGLRAVAVSHLSTQDSGWRYFPAVIVRRELCSQQVPPELVRAVGIAYGHLTCLGGKWDGETASVWLSAESASAERNQPEEPAPVAGHGPSGASDSVTAALGALADLFRPTDRVELAPRLAVAADLLRQCAASLAPAMPARLATELETAAAGLTALGRDLAVEAEAAAPPAAAPSAQLAPPVPPRQSPPVQPLRNGDFAQELQYWEPIVDAATTPPTVLLKVQADPADGVSHLRLERAEGAFTLGSGGVVQQLEVPVPAGTPLRLEAQVLVEAHSPAGGGSLGTVFPLRMSLHYLTDDGAKHTFTHAFYAVGQALLAHQATKVIPGEWSHYRSPDLATLVPRPARITHLEVTGSGHSFRAAVRRVSLR